NRSGPLPLWIGRRGEDLFQRKTVERRGQPLLQVGWIGRAYFKVPFFSNHLKAQNSTALAGKRSAAGGLGEVKLYSLARQRISGLGLRSIVNGNPLPRLQVS